MTSITTEAPGKLLIAGEYSVLFGGKALVAVIDRFAQVCFSPQANRECWMRYHTQWQRDDNHPLWRSMLKVAEKYELPPVSGIYRLDTKDFFGSNGQKLGLGSSAAAIVALSKMICFQYKVLDPEFMHKLALEAHLDFSSQLGSGADIASCAIGSSIEFRKVALGSHKVMTDLSWLWPELIIISTKRAQDTRVFVGKAEAYAKKEPSAIDSFMARSDVLVKSLQRKPSLDATIAILNELNELLRDFGQACAIDIISEEHDALHRLALSMGGSAKPSGAGGGDLSLALIPLAKRADFLRQSREQGFESISLALI